LAAGARQTFERLLFRRFVPPLLLSVSMVRFVAQLAIPVP
jgi:hypothetical protein